MMNAGKQLKIIAIVLGVLVVIAGLMFTYAISSEWSWYYGGRIFFLGLVASVALGYLSSIFLYAFGVLVENSAKTVATLERLETLEKLEATKNAAKPKVAVNFTADSPAPDSEAPED